MNTNSRRGGRSFRSRRNSANMSSVISGFKYTPSEMPPVITSQPWNSVVVMFQVTSSTELQSLTLLDLKKKMRIQLGFNKVLEANIEFDVRLESISMWAVADKTHLVMFPADYTRTDNIELSRVESHAQRNMYARVGFRFPAHISATPMSTRSTTKTVLGYVSSVSSTCEIHVKLMWKGADTALAVPRVDYDYVPICSGLRELADKLESLPLEPSDYDPLQDLPEVEKL